MNGIQSLHDIRNARAVGVRPLSPRSPLGVGEIVPMETRQFVLRIAPSEATVLLGNLHPRQRRINKERVAQYLRSMQTGHWYEPPFTFDSIAFDVQGRLCNGAHRLTALSQHDKPLSFYVIFGVQSPEDMPLPQGDTGYSRSKAFVAGINRHEWAVVSYLAEHVFRSMNPAFTDVQLLYPLFADALAEIPRLVSSQSAPIRAAFVFAFASDSDYLARLHVAEQWRAYCHVDVKTMWPSIGRLYKKMGEIRGQGRGGNGRHFRFESAVYALGNPPAMKILRQLDAGARVREWAVRELAQGAE